MSELEPKEKSWMQLITIRNLTVLLMALAVAIALIFSKTEHNENAEKGTMLLEKNSRFVIRMVVAEAVGLKVSGPEASDSGERLRSDIESMFDMLRAQYRDNMEIIVIQEYIILDYLEESSGKIPLAENKSDSYTTDFLSIYGNGKPVSDESVLFNLEAGKLARIKNERLKGNTQEADNLEKELYDSSVTILSLSSILFLIGLSLFVGSAMVVTRFIYRRPPKRFFKIVRSLYSENHRNLLDTFVLYLFLSFPVGAVLLGKLEEPDLSLQLGYMLLTFVVSLTYYYTSSGGGISFKKLFLDPGPINMMKEITWGLLGFTGIFPVAVMATLLTLSLVGESSGDMRFAHPAVFEMQENPWLIGAFAIIGAPILEETMFRSFFYGFLRKYMRVRSAAFISGLVFALLHPQGWVALPYLTVLGMGLAILREYRPGIISSVITHGLVNTFAVITIYLVFYAGN